MKQVNYDVLNKQLESLIKDVPHVISNLSNASALVYQTLPDLNWAGFYIMQDSKLILGPFQGKPACIEIEIGKGVCGTAVQLNQTMVVNDVHKFPGHIACDSASNSEIVIPIHLNNKIFGVLDIDAPIFDRFKEEDEEGLTKLVETIEASLNETIK